MQLDQLSPDTPPKKNCLLFTPPISGPSNKKSQNPNLAPAEHTIKTLEVGCFLFVVLRKQTALLRSAGLTRLAGFCEAELAFFFEQKKGT